jgi:hypothetical protein
MSRRTVLPRSPSLGWPAGVEWRPQNKLASAAKTPQKLGSIAARRVKARKASRRSAPIATIDWLAQSWREAELMVWQNR